VGEVNALLEGARLDLVEARLDHKPSTAWVTHYAHLKQTREEAQAAEAEAQRFIALVKEKHGEDSKRFQEALAEAEATRQSFETRVQAAEKRLAQAADLFGEPSAEYLAEIERTSAVEKDAKALFTKITEQIAELDARMEQHQLELSTADGKRKLLGVADVVRAVRSNQLTVWGKIGVLLSRWSEFLFDVPREANSEGGVWPAIVGTITMTLLMSVAVVPFGVLAALYLREYAKGGLVVSIVRISINNLAGVPSIVFGVFGLGFFCYLVGAYVDGGPRNIQIQPWPALQWWLVLTVVIVVGVGAFFASFLGAVRQKSAVRTGRKPILPYVGVALWLTTVAGAVLLLLYSPHFQGLYRARLADNQPTFGTDGLMWASFTLALLTAPVVIVATEEALAAVPNSMREGSYACGASKWQTVKRIVLPRALPGIMTGMVLAIARGAGEVAPLMLVGAEKWAPALPVDGSFPFVHLERTFMHLGFHIYDLGFQSPNAEAAKPMVFSTTLLLILIVFFLNVFGVWLRTRLRKKFASAQF
jgi:ABC-type phosphate transport system permease subunit